jgi:hypothetical protein
MFTGFTGVPLGKLKGGCEGNNKIDLRISAVAWIEFIWLRIGPSCGLREQDNKPLSSIKFGDVSECLKTFKSILKSCGQ